MNHDIIFWICAAVILVGGLFDVLRHEGKRAAPPTAAQYPPPTDAEIDLIAERIGQEWMLEDAEELRRIEAGRKLSEAAHGNGWENED